MNYQRVYPEVYFKVMPFIMMAVDEMDAYNMGMPTYDTVRQISDQIHDDVLRVHPDLAEEDDDYQEMPDDYQEMSYEAAAAYDMEETYAETQRFHRRRHRFFFRDLLDILLLNEIFFRRRRF